MPESLTMTAAMNGVLNKQNLNGAELQFENGVTQMEQDIGESIERSDTMVVAKEVEDLGEPKTDFSKNILKKLKIYFKDTKLSPKSFKLKLSKYLRLQMKTNDSTEYALFLESICMDRKEFTRKVNLLLKASAQKEKKKIIKSFFKIINKKFKK